MTDQEILEKQKFKAHKVMTPDEYAAMPLIGWHMVCRDFDGFGGVGIRFVAPPGRPVVQWDDQR